MPADILQLGESLVDELGLKDSNDTLGRWMAHYLAELLTSVKAAKTSNDKKKAQAMAADLILRIWETRHTVGAGLDLWKDLRPIFISLNSLSSKNVFAIRGIKGVSSLKEVHDDYRKFIKLSLLQQTKQPTVEKALARVKKLSKFLTATEKKLFSDFAFWVSEEPFDIFLSLEDKKPKPSAKNELSLAVGKLKQSLSRLESQFSRSAVSE